jgi:hypothetical protein
MIKILRVFLWDPPCKQFLCDELEGNLYAELTVLSICHQAATNEDHNRQRRHNVRSRDS